MIYNLKHEDILEAEAYPHPVMLLDADYKIIYKNTAAKSASLKPRLGSNIEKYMDSANIKKLYEANKKKEFRILKICAQSPIKRFIFHPGSETVKAAIFYKTFNFIKEGGENEDEIIKNMEKIVYQYYEKEQQVKSQTGPVRDDSFYAENYKKISKVTEHFVKHMNNLNPLVAGKDKSYCDIGLFLNNFASGISQYVSSFGYKIVCRVEDKMFFYRLNEDDLLLINLILSAAAFKYSIFKKVDIRFFSNFSTGIIRYEFRAANDFFKTHEDMFVSDYLNEIKDIEYLDMYLAALVAKNNDLKLTVYFDSEKGSGVCFDLIFGEKKTDLRSPGSDEPGSHITAEKIKEKAETEFAGLFGWH